MEVQLYSSMVINNNANKFIKLIFFRKVTYDYNNLIIITIVCFFFKLQKLNFCNLGILIWEITLEHFTSRCCIQLHALAVHL